RLDEVRIAVDGDRRQAGQVAEAVAAMAKAQNRPVLRVEVPVREHPHAQHMKAVLLLLTLFGGLALVLSGALTANVITGLLARQVRQIGVLKAIGARTGQICGLYGALTALLAGPGVVLGLALGVLGVQAMSRPISLELNLNPDSLAVPPDALLLVAAFAVIVPALAVALPIRRAVGRPVRELLQDPGLSAPDATPWRWRIGDRRTTLALRNTVRRPGRLALTMIALGLGGAALMTCANLYASLVRGVDQALAGRADSVEVRLAKPLPAEAFRARIAALPGVQSVEVWGATLAAIQLPGDGAARLGTNPYAVLAPPPGSRMVGARLVDGRWPRRRGEIVINRNILSLEPALGQGQAVLLSGGRSVPVHVVGLVEEVSEPHIYAAASTVDALVGQGGLAGASRLVARPGEEARVSAAVEDLAAEMGSLPSYAATRQAFRQTLTEHFAILLTMLSVAAAAAIAVGGLGLAATASLNVLERRREIGVLRALGARRATLRMILLAEGALIALASSLAAVLVALPLSAHIGLILGRRQLFTTLPFVVEPAGLLIWLGVVTIVTLAACWGAADRALKLPVRDVLAYE
uniref:ABC transporter permease n=1 Tax=uncultured Caulobacter sp. TaxID=158749 RepID=UPI0025D9B072